MYGSSTQEVPTTTSRKQTLDLGGLLWGYGRRDQVSDALLTGPGGGKVGCGPAAFISKHEDAGSSRSSAAYHACRVNPHSRRADLLQIHFPGALTQEGAARQR